MAEGSSKKAVVAAMLGNLAVAIAKFIAAGVTGSSAILSEAIHSVVDTGDGVLLFVGLRRSQKPANGLHPFGYGKEIYFWTLVVATLVFAVGGGMSVYEGITHLIHPHPLGDPKWNYLVLLVAALFEGASWVVSAKEFRKSKGRRGVWQTVQETKDPSIFAVLFEDSAALIGIVIAFLGVFLGYHFQNPLFDGLASVLIGLLLMGMSVLLARETRSLLIGESASPAVIESVRQIMAANPSVLSVGRIFSAHYGPNYVTLDVELRFRREISAADAAKAIEQMEREIRERHAEVKSLFVEAQSLVPRSANI